MANIPLMRIDEPGRRPPPTGFALWALGFRPFYLGASLFAVIAIVIWVGVLLGHLHWPGPGTLSTMHWHAHEMVFGFGAAVVVGFLFTAGSNWSGTPPAKGPLLMAVFGLWLIARLSFAAGWLSLAAVADLSFNFLACVLLARVLILAKLWKNLGIAALLGALGIANLNFYLALSNSSLLAAEAGLLVIMLLLILMGGRVIPGFTKNVQRDTTLWQPAWLERLILPTSLLAVVAWLTLGSPWTLPLCLFAALLHFLRWLGWHPWTSIKHPMLWVLHLGYAWIPLVFLGLVLNDLGLLARSTALHGISTGAMALMIIGMMTRTARGHTGRPVQAGRAEVAAFTLLAMGGFLRLAAGLPAGATVQLQLLAATGLCWAIAFALYAWRFAPWLWQPRLDGRPG